MAFGIMRRLRLERGDCLSDEIVACEPPSSGRVRSRWPEKSFAMDSYDFEVVVIGAGIAGATAAAHLSADRRVALIEAEDVAGYHTTGRSTALWILNYGPADVRGMTGLSRSFFEAPPPGFSETPLMSRRPVVTLATPAQEPEFQKMLAQGRNMRELSAAELKERIPALRPGYAAAAAIED